MTKKPKAKKPFEHVMSAEHIKPGPLAYSKAFVLVILNWIKRHKIIAVIFIALVLSVAVAALFYINRTDKILTDEQIITSVNKVLKIEGDGNPAILTINDKTKANQAQPFLDIAEEGDKVLLYYKAKKAVLYRPSGNQIIREGSFTPPSAKIFIRKGTNDDDKIKNVESKLEQVNEVELISQDSSPRQDYEGVTLVSVTDRYDDKLQELEKIFGVEAQRLPAGESFPEADILIIVGR